MDYRMLTNGRLVTADKMIGVVNPATEEVFAQVPHADDAQLNEALEAATLEIGGNDPVILLPDVDIGKTAEKVYAGAVHSANVPRAAEIAGRIQSGSVWVNQQLNIGAHIPMAGFKGSGLGVEQSVEGLAEYTQMQVINVAKI